jgi:hypothetical protein
MVYVQRRYRASAAAAEAARFHCMHCDYACDAFVSGVGHGSGVSPFLLDDDGARERANDEAMGNLRFNMDVALRCATCPRCGKHDASSRRDVYITSLVPALAVGLILGVAILLICQLSLVGWVAGVAACAIVAAIIAVIRNRRVLSGVILVSDERPARSSRLGL